MADAPVIRLGTHRVTGDAEASQRVIDAITALLPPLVEEAGPASVLDGLASVYACLAVAWLGEAQAQDALRRYLRAIPRFAALQRAQRGETGSGRG